MSPLHGKHIVLGISGGIAAYKSVYLLRLLIKEGAEVQIILTPSAKEFITPVTLSSLSGKPVISEFFNANTGEWHSHVDLGLWADAFVIAPATANTIAKMATGVADNMLLTSYLSCRCKVFAAPTMDLDMYSHPTTQRNLKILEGDDVYIIDPTEGELASGLSGKGRMAEPERIVECLKKYFARKLTGKKALVTAGPTYEKIDPVRFIGNFSSGKMGFALAEALADAGIEVTLVCGPNNLEIKKEGIERIDVVSADEMLKACEEVYGEVDYAFFSAAVADYKPSTYSENKIKKEQGDIPEIRLVKNPDIASTLGKRKTGQINVGFALETDNELENAKKKLKTKNFDWIVLNSLRDKNAGFMHDTNKVTLISKDDEVISFDTKSKKEVARDIMETVIGKIN